jgi:heptosyltransferase-1
MEPHPSYLIIKCSAIGDVIQALPALQYLRQTAPNAHITWVVEAPIAPLLTPLISNGLLDQVLPIDTRSWRKNFFHFKTLHRIFSTIKALRRQRHTTLFDLQGNLKSALITLLARAHSKIGFDPSLKTEWPSHWAYNQYYRPNEEISRPLHYLGMIQYHLGSSATPTLPPLEIHSSQSDSSDVPATIARLSLYPTLLIAPNSRWENKCLSASHWKLIIESLLHAFPHLHLAILWGNESELDLANSLATSAPDNTFILPKVPLDRVQSLMKPCIGVVAMDSMALYLAQLAHIPTFSFFGPSVAHRYHTIASIGDPDRHQSWQGTCPYGEEFTFRCDKMRTCSTGACLKTPTTLGAIAKMIAWISKRITS